MVDIPRSSFIPKETSAAIPTRVRRRRTFHVFSFLASTLLIVSLLLAAGTYLYKINAEKNQAAIKEQLSLQRGLFNEAQLLEIREFDRRLRAATFLLNNHLAPSKVFAALERETMNRIQFTKFSYKYNYPIDIILTLDGDTREFKTVALQAREFAAEPLFASSIFSNLGTAAVAQLSGGSGAPPTTSGVHFTVEGSVDQSLLKYEAPATLPTSAANFQEMLQGSSQGNAAGTTSTSISE